MSTAIDQLVVAIDDFIGAADQLIGARLDQLRDESRELESARSTLQDKTKRPSSPTPPKPSRTPQRRSNGARPTRAQAGATTDLVINALVQSGVPMTAAQVAKSTGQARATVSTTLARLRKQGRVAKAQRGYTVN